MHLKKIVSDVFQILTSDLISGPPYPTSGFPIFIEISKYYLCTCLVLCIKFGVPIFTRFGYIKRLIFALQSHIRTLTHILTDQFAKTTFVDSRDLKTYKSGENSTSKILTELCNNKVM